MKKINLLLFLTFLLFTPITAQIIEENFDYPLGVFSVVFQDWAITGRGTTEATIVTGSLTYSNYLSSGVGNKLNITSSGSTDYVRSLGTPITSGTVYVSLLLDVLNDSGISGVSTDGDYFIHFEDGGSNPVRLQIREGSTNAVYQLGLAKQTGSTELYLTNKELNYNETYLVVFSYTFNNVTIQDDEMKLWVNPSLSGTEPSADLTFSDGQTDAAKLDDIDIRQGANTPNAYIDGIRVSTSWSTSPLPVELKLFTASYSNNQVNLLWETQTEINNYGFEIERSVAQINNLSTNWQKIAFIQGHGNSNSVKQYSYSDNTIIAGKAYSYRLKQIDFDGKFEYSSVVNVEAGTPNKYELAQNYPNPFNPTTTIKYSIPANVKREMSNVKLIVYDILGNEVASLVNEQKSAGKYEVNFDASNLSSGVYFYTLKAGNFNQVKKMILVK